MEKASERHFQFGKGAHDKILRERKITKIGGPSLRLSPRERGERERVVTMRKRGAVIER
jgi:hypothetical protein